MKRDILEDKLNKTLYGLEAEPSPELWDRVAKSLEQKPALAPKTPLLRRKAFGVAASVAVAAAIFVGIFIIRDIDNQSQFPETVKKIAEIKLPEPKKEEPHKVKIEVAEKEINTKGKIVLASTSSVIAENEPIKIIIPEKLETPQEIVVVEKQQNSSSSLFDNSQEITSAETSLQIVPVQAMPSIAQQIDRPKSSFLKRVAVSVFGSSHASFGFENASYSTSDMSSWFRGTNSTDNLYTTIKHLRPITFGVNAICILKNDLSIESGLLFTGTRSEGSGSTSATNYSVECRQIYMGIPLAIKYNFSNSEKLRFYSSLGFMVERGIYGELDTNMSRIYTGISESNTQKVKFSGVVASVNAGIGVEYRVMNSLGIYAEPTINYYPDASSFATNFISENPFYFGIKAGLRIKVK
ncbi:MAG: outer membrane beta-barrel protein [Rikenellaceae bacterium]